MCACVFSPVLERMVYIFGQLHAKKSSILSFAYVRLYLLLDIQEWFFSVLEKMRGTDGLHWGVVSNLQRIMAMDPRNDGLRCELLKF
jgi:hypothetical protein